MERKLYKPVTADLMWKDRLLQEACDHALYDVYTSLAGRRGVVSPPPLPPQLPLLSQKPGRKSNCSTRVTLVREWRVASGDKRGRIYPLG